MFKRIVAIAGIVLLFSLYIITIVVSLIGDELNMRWLMAAVFATFFIPLILYAMLRYYDYRKKLGEEKINDIKKNK